MEISLRSLWALVHGMFFGVLYLMACSGALVELYRNHYSCSTTTTMESNVRFLRRYLAAMAVLAWFAVLTGAYIVYPWYRAVPPAGTADLNTFPQRLLMSSPSTIAWHSIGMEWKEHVAWLVPIAITMAASVFYQYGARLKEHSELRRAVLCFVWVSLVAAGIAGFFGAMINKAAPINGGPTFHIAGGD